MVAILVLVHVLIFAISVASLSGCAGVVEAPTPEEPVTAAVPTTDAGSNCAVEIDGAVCFCDETTCKCPTVAPRGYVMCASSARTPCGYPNDLTRSRICYPIDGRYLCESASDASVWCEGGRK